MRSDVKDGAVEEKPSFHAKRFNLVADRGEKSGAARVKASGGTPLGVALAIPVPPREGIAICPLVLACEVRCFPRSPA